MEGAEQQCSPRRQPDTLNSVCGTFGDSPEFIKVAADVRLRCYNALDRQRLQQWKTLPGEHFILRHRLVADIGQSGNPPAIGSYPANQRVENQASIYGIQNFNFGFSQFVVSNVGSCSVPVTSTRSRRAWRIQSLTLGLAQCHFSERVVSIRSSPIPTVHVLPTRLAFLTSRLPDSSSRTAITQILASSSAMRRVDARLGSAGSFQSAKQSPVTAASLGSPAVGAHFL